jgi:hypothetical protein
MASGSGMLLDSKLPMRDLTGKYARFRNEFFLSSSSASSSGHSRLSASPQPSSLSGPLLDSRPGASSELDELGLSGPTLRPEWADIHDQVEADMRQIKEGSQCCCILSAAAAAAVAAIRILASIIRCFFLGLD